MASKRSLSPSDMPKSENKRPRISSTDGIESLSQSAPLGARADEHEEAVASLAPTHHSNARSGLQRSIALVLKHDGFESATDEAMESFTGIVETYIESMIEEVKRFALAARREHPIPTDFELVMGYYNLTTRSLRPHLKNPLPQSEVAPKFQVLPTADNEALATLPLLSDELSGQADKDAKQYIPSSFPDFPSRHTYRFTPQEDTSVRDSKKIREEAARTAEQGEDALRRLVRASKMRKQKEVKSLVERDTEGKERFRLWEATMKRFMGAEAGLRSDGAAADQVEIADHSMIVNGDTVFARKEVARMGKRVGGLSANGT
ncbi:bromodomain associated domain-containingprotein [Purpureocillium lilacinum]|uniref:Transcription initiation factor TFIID subunit 8 n=1 Tax=Purpureocillium lilacinum TaxID=33203 RepID=A0A179GT59_PURLI|nr:bromodomain associated domain-containingprotein [Purpureocillium lilacinum]OAQ81126.1 bromodomain associated domain-containingprotein [Purpureocillium lilacinum]